jgi:CheY-like chemotaxis protein
MTALKLARMLARTNAGVPVPPTPVLPDMGGMCVVVVGVIAEENEAVAHVLRQAGATVFAASSTFEALLRVSIVEIDVVVVLTMEPGVDPFDLVRGIRDLPKEMGGLTPAVVDVQGPAPSTLTATTAARSTTHLTHFLESIRSAGHRGDRET